MKYSVILHPSLVRTLVEIQGSSEDPWFWLHGLIKDIQDKFYNSDPFSAPGGDEFGFEFDVPMDKEVLESEIISHLVEYVNESDARCNKKGIRHLFVQKFCYDLGNLGIEVRVQ